MADTATLFLIGQGVQAGGKFLGGMRAREAGEYNAASLERQAAEERAAAGRTAAERRLETERVISRQVALAAASGAGAGPSLVDIIGDTAARGEYQAQSERYLGEARARNLTDRANIARYEGENAFMGSILEGVSGIALGGARHGMLYGGGTRTPGIGPWRTTVSYG